MVKLTELTGVAAGRAENLTDAGYTEVEDLVDADPEEIADEVNYLPEDTALELVVQAKDIVEDNDADESNESKPLEEDAKSITEEVGVEEALEELPDGEELEEELNDLEEEVEKEVEEEVEEEFTFTVEFDSSLQYDTFFDSVMGQRSKMLRSNRTGIEAFNHALKQMRNGGMSEPVELTMTEGELNDLHNCVRQKTVSYKGDNLIDHMDALNGILDQINEVRDEHLF